jgi:nucleolar protein 14
LHKAHAKRLRDAGFVREDEGDVNSNDTYTIWPSTGVILLLRVIGHIFPVTDKKHPIVTPLILFLGQILTTTPLLSKYDLVAGLMCCGMLLEYTKEAKRVVPEAHAFLAGVIRLFANCQDEKSNKSTYSLPTIGVAANDEAFQTLRNEVSTKINQGNIQNLSLEKKHIQKGTDSAASILVSALYFVECTTNNNNGALSGAEREAFAEITESVLSLDPKNKSYPLPKEVQLKVASVAATLEKVCKFSKPRVPLQRRAGDSSRGVAIKSLAPRIENPDKYSMSKDKGKSANQSAADRTRREYKREHKAVVRELRLDGTFIENERRIEETKKADAARAKRHKAFAWLEGEQAAMNQQVRLGGGLLQGGGTGAAKMKARSGKLGIKKGGKF